MVRPSSMFFSPELIVLDKKSLHPPALECDDEEEIPSVLLEYEAYVADRRNDTTAVAYSRCGREVQVTFFAARPPRVSYLCVFCRPSAAAAEESLIAIEPEVRGTDDNLVLLRIVVSPKKDLVGGNDYYVYGPAGDDGPMLKRLPPAPGAIFLVPCQVGILSFFPANRAPEDNNFFMVAALQDDDTALARGRFVLYLYNSKIRTWTATNVSVENQHFQKYNDRGYFLHHNTRVIAVGGEDATIAFVDLWRGILLCDLSHVKDKPWLRYVPLPGPSGSPSLGDACRSRDIAVVNGHFMFIRNRFQWKDCPTCCREGMQAGWKSGVWTRPVSACSVLDDSWQRVCQMDSSAMDVKSCPDFQLLPKLGDSNNALLPFHMFDISLPTLSLLDDDTAWFMVKAKKGDAKAWVVAVDISNNRLQGIAKFDARRYIITGFAYMLWFCLHAQQHIQISQQGSGQLFCLIYCV